MRESIYGKSKVEFRQTSPKNWGFRSDDPRKWGAKCDQCPLNGQQPVWGDGPPNALVAYLGEAPGRDEVAMGIPFIGRSGQTFENWLGKKKLTRNDVWVDNAIMCFPPGGELKLFLQVARKTHKANQKGVKKDEQVAFSHPVDCCRPRLMAQLRIPRCENCSTAAQPKWLRGPDKFLCTCKTPRVLPIYKQMAKEGFVPARVWQQMGNFAMESTLGFSGITAHRGYCENMAERRSRVLGLPYKEPYATSHSTPELGAGVKPPSGMGGGLPPRKGVRP